MVSLYGRCVNLPRDALLNAEVLNIPTPHFFLELTLFVLRLPQKSFQHPLLIVTSPNVHQFSHLSYLSAPLTAVLPTMSNQREKYAGKAFQNKDVDGHNLPPSPAPSSPHNGRRYALATELVYTEGGDQYNASSVPIYQVREAIRSIRLEN